MEYLTSIYITSSAIFIIGLLVIMTIMSAITFSAPSFKAYAYIIIIGALWPILPFWGFGNYMIHKFSKSRP